VSLQCGTYMGVVHQGPMLSMTLEWQWLWLLANSIVLFLLFISLFVSFVAVQKVCL
jgi:hypothetical protein